LRDAYHVAVEGMTAASVPLGHPVNSLELLEVGVQVWPNLRGRIDFTSITKTCPKDIPAEPLAEAEDPDAPPPLAQAARVVTGGVAAGAPTCRRNALIRMAKEKVRAVENPPMGLIFLAGLEETAGCGK
jgi:hypothetical protein